MRKPGLIWSVAFCAVAATLSANEFPLTFKALTVDEAFALPGGSGAIGSLRAGKPPSVRNEPKSVSKHALYGELLRSQSERGFMFRLDESAGDGKGYDKLVLDLNQNGDLTDDPVFTRADKPRVTKTGAETREVCRFGPIEAPAANAIGNSRPVYFAELNYYRRQTDPGLRGYLGYLRLRAGSYFETMVELDGVRRKVGVVDGNANLRLGDEPKAVTYKGASEENWYFTPADSFLVDADGSGQFDNRPGNPESSPFGSLLYLGTTPYRVTLAAKATALRIEPWTAPLAELDVRPSGTQVREVQVAWERKSGDWALVKAGVAEGRARVPAGKLRLIGCVLEGKSKDGQLLAVAGSYRKLDNTLDARAGKSTTLKCGAPLEMRLTTARGTASATGLMDQADSTGSSASPIVQIRAEIIGVAGETYATFARGKDLSGEPPKPRFAIHTKDGKQVASGNLEFG